jgi:hypothetical protein
MTKLPRLWDEKITTAKGRKVKRYRVRTFPDRINRRGVRTFARCYQFMVMDTKAKGVPPTMYPGIWPTFRTRKAAENWLKKTTVRSYQLQEVERKLDKIA